jgi:hypothetical protein
MDTIEFGNSIFIFDLIQNFEQKKGELPLKNKTYILKFVCC